MSYEEEKRLSRELFGKYKFLRDIVGLYVEGVTWGGCKLICDKRGGGDEGITDISADDLKAGVQNMLIDGHGDYKLHIFGKENVITITMLPEFAFAGEEGGQPLLWPVTRNAVPLDSMMSSIGKLTPEGNKFVRSMLDDICSGIGVPYAFLIDDPRIFVNTLAVRNILMVFKGRVKNIRRSVEFGLTQYTKRIDSENSPDGALVSVEWNEDWCSNDDYGVSYQIFRSQGIVLSTLRAEEIATANWAYQNHMMSRETYNRKTKGFD